MPRRCSGRVPTPGGSRPCKLPAQKGSRFCHTHTGSSSAAAPEPATRLGDEGRPEPVPAAGGGRGIDSLVADEAVWGELLDAIGARIRQPHLFERMAHKDLHVTEAIRHAVVPSVIYPDAEVVFKGGTSLAKAYPILNRFSEDVDVNIIPPSGQRFGDSRRKKIRRELHARLDERILLPMTHQRHGTNFATTTIRYPTPPPEPAAAGAPGATTATGPTFGEVLVEMNIRSQPPGMHDMRTVTSLAGEAAAELDPTLLVEYPFLRPFEVLTADPIIAVVDKLDALHWRGDSDEPKQIGTRARDIYDLACLLRHETVRTRLNSDLVAEMHKIIVDSIPAGLAARATPRPRDGFAASAAFQPGHPACEALRAAYPTIRSLVYADEHWIEFHDALDTICGSANLI